jgi:hypothetical protein
VADQALFAVDELLPSGTNGDRTVDDPMSANAMRRSIAAWKGVSRERAFPSGIPVGAGVGGCCAPAWTGAATDATVRSARIARRDR